RKPSVASSNIAGSWPKEFVTLATDLWRTATDVTDIVARSDRRRGTRHVHDVQSQPPGAGPAIPAADARLGRHGAARTAHGRDSGAPPAAVLHRCHGNNRSGRRHRPAARAAARLLDDDAVSLAGPRRSHRPWHRWRP